MSPFGVQQGGSVLSEQCPSRQVLDLLADKWCVLVVYVLASASSPKGVRYSALQRAIEGVSQKMLTQTLRALERDGFVTRTVHPVVPPVVEYALTPLGRSIVEPLDALCSWAQLHMREVHDARMAFEARPTLVLR